MSLKQKIAAAVRKVDGRISRRYFGEVTPEALAPCYLTRTSGWPFRDVPMPPEPAPALVESFRRYQEAEQHEHLIHYAQPVILEPRYGLAVTAERQVIRESVPYDEPYRQASVLDWMRFPTRKIEHKAVISLRYLFENYWHFHNDALGQLMLCERMGLPPDLPVVIPAKALTFPWVREIFSFHPAFRDRTWILQEADEFLAVEQVYFAKNMPDVRQHFDEMLKYFPRPQEHDRSEIKLFIKRGKARLRGFRNSDEIEATAVANGFQVVDCEKLTVREQINLFGRAAYVVGAHGAALTNTIHRRGRPCSILEICPLSNIPPHFWWLAHALGYGYDAMVGEAEQGAFFDVNVAELDRRMKRMIRHGQALHADA